MYNTECIVNNCRFYKQIDDIDIPLDKIEHLNLRNSTLFFLCVKHPFIETKLKKMNNLKFLTFGNKCFETIDKMFCLEYIDLLVSIVQIKQKAFGYYSCVGKIGNMKNEQMAICTDFTNPIDISKVKILNFLL